MASASNRSRWRAFPFSSRSAEDIGIAHLDPNELSFGGGPRGDRRGGDTDVEALDPRGNLRKLGDSQLAAIGEHNGAKDGVFQLPHIARPIVGAEQGERLGADPANGLSFRGGESRAKPARETGDIVPPGTQRRDGNWKHIDAMIKVSVAEAAVFYLFDQISIGRENQANVSSHRALRPGAMDLALLEDA